ncbi:MAG: hypothetical protein IKT70_04925 [Clostridia bacterium]|nr:hypothetical protein [Clostridia bacterium]
MEKVKKEILTEENIKRDLIVTAYDGVEKKVDPLYYSVPVLLVIGVIMFFVTKIPWFLLIGVVTFFIIIPIVIIKDEIRHRRLKEAIVRDGFVIREDTLSHVQLETELADHTVRMLHGISANSLKKCYVFHFSGCEWTVPKVFGSFYKWSDTYYMSAEGIYNTSIPGDEFYIVERKFDGKIGCIYNKKFFEYKKQISE